MEFHVAFNIHFQDGVRHLRFGGNRHKSSICQASPVYDPAKRFKVIILFFFVCIADLLWKIFERNCSLLPVFYIYRINHL